MKRRSPVTGAGGREFHGWDVPTSGTTATTRLCRSGRRPLPLVPTKAGTRLRGNEWRRELFPGVLANERGVPVIERNEPRPYLSVMNAAGVLSDAAETPINGGN